MGKRIYRAVDVKSVSADALSHRLSGGRVAVGVDIAKRVVYAALVNAQRETVVTLKWAHPAQTRSFVALLTALCATGIALEVALEPSGTYGDPLRYLLTESGIAVFRVSPKRVSDAAEVFDGVPSIHDAKAAALIARLHLDGASKPWVNPDDAQRTRAAAVATLERVTEQHQSAQGQLEAQLARHFPEVTELLSLGDATLVQLLAELGGPQAIATVPDRARDAMRRFSHGLLLADKVDRVIAAAHTTLGVPMIDAEIHALKTLAAEGHRAYRAHREATRRLVTLTADDPACAGMRPVVGAATAAVIVTTVGDPQRFASAQAYRKAFGLNLRERSSGRKQGKLSITKRGPGRARRFLHLAVLGLIQRNPIVAAYYRQKVAEKGGQHKLIATTAVMRKVALALWHVGRGAPFDAAKLFDTSRLTLPQQVRDHLNRRRVAFVADVSPSSATCT